MNKRGQFFLIMTVMIVGLISSIAFVSNSAIKKSDPRFSYVGNELKFESERVLEYATSANGDAKANLTAFSKNYSTYSSADNFYYIFGNSTEITFAGLQKNEEGKVNITLDSGETQIDLQKNVFETRNFAPAGNSVNLTIEDAKYSFILNSGWNFYFVVSKEIGGDVYVVTNG